MNQGIFATLFFVPLYNGLIALINVVPGQSAGLAVILLTLIIKLILFPLSKKSIKTQLAMRRLEPEIEKMKEQYPDKQEQARQLMKIYKDQKVNPFAGFLLILIQFPVLIALYQVFQSGLPVVKEVLLYSPSLMVVPSMAFFGIDLTQKSIILALLAVITQFIQFQIVMPPTKPNKDGKSSFQNDLAKSMNVQMKYIFPLIIFPIAYISSVLGLYFAVGNVLTIIQEVVVRRRLEREHAAQQKTA